MWYILESLLKNCNSWHLIYLSLNECDILPVLNDSLFFYSTLSVSSVYSLCVIQVSIKPCLYSPLLSGKAGLSKLPHINFYMVLERKDLEPMLPTRDFHRRTLTSSKEPIEERIHRGMASSLPTENLDRNNYASWSYKMHQHLLGHGYWNYVEGANEVARKPTHKDFLVL